MSVNRGTKRTQSNDVKNKLNKRFKSEHVTIDDRRYCKWQTNWHMSILYRLNMPLAMGLSPWYLMYDEHILYLVENNYIRPCYTDIKFINKLINQLEVEPEMLITKPRDVVSIEYELHTLAKLHSDFFGIWHITNMKYNWDAQEYDRSNGISIINNTLGQLWSCNENNKLFEVIYIYGWNGSLHLCEVYQIIDSYKHIRLLSRLNEN